MSDKGRGRGRGRARGRVRDTPQAPGRPGPATGTTRRETTVPQDRSASAVTGTHPTAVRVTAVDETSRYDPPASVGVSIPHPDRSTQPGRQVADGPAHDRETAAEARGSTASSRHRAPPRNQSTPRSSTAAGQSAQTGISGSLPVSPLQATPMPAATGSSTSSVLVASSQTTRKAGNPDWKPPRRPDFGREGKPIALRANRFKVSLSDKLDYIHHYDVKFDPPELKPAKISWKIIETWATNYKRELGGIRPVFDGKSNMYTARLLPNKGVTEF